LIVAYNVVGAVFATLLCAAVRFVMFASISLAKDSVTKSEQPIIQT
jgi:hypothetical protein